MIHLFSGAMRNEEMTALPKFWTKLWRPDGIWHKIVVVLRYLMNVVAISRKGKWEWEHDSDWIFGLRVTSPTQNFVLKMG